MVRAEVEIYDDVMCLCVPADELTNRINERLIADGWHLATNGFKKGEIWYTIYEKRM